jgi:hypothetical protein
LALWPNAGSAKPIATMIPTQNCFIGVSTGAIKCREARSIKTTDFQVQLPPWPGPPCNFGALARPVGSSNETRSAVCNAARTVGIRQRLRTAVRRCWAPRTPCAAITAISLCSSFPNRMMRRPLPSALVGTGWRGAVGGEPENKRATRARCSGAAYRDNGNADCYASRPWIHNGRGSSVEKTPSWRTPSVTSP